MSDTNVVTALTAFNAAIAAASPLAKASFASLIPIKTAGGNLTSAIQAQMLVLDAGIVANPLVVGDLGIDALATALDVMNNESDLMNAFGYFGRAVVNITNSTG